MAVNLEEAQKLGEKLHEMILEARPLLKDLNGAIKETKRIIGELEEAVDKTVENAKEAAKTYQLSIKLSDHMEGKLETLFENMIILDEELEKLAQIRKALEKDVMHTMRKFRCPNCGEVHMTGL